MTTLAPMFDIDELLTGSGPGVRATDRITSHVAADASRVHMRETKRNILHILSFTGPLAGSELNARYPDWARSEGWRRTAWDTPRKRAGELARDGFLDDSETRIAEGNNLPESIYCLTDKGREVLS